jgi:hypothetical protein
MTYDKNNEKKLPSILCGDILGKLVTHETNEYILNGHSMNEKNSTERLKHASSEKDDDVTKEEVMGEMSNENVVEIGCHPDGKPSTIATSNQINKTQQNLTTKSDDSHNDKSRIEKRKQPFRLECLALITYSLNLNPSIRKQISLEMSSLTTDRELYIRSARPSVDKVPLSLSQPPPSLPSIQPANIDKDIITSQSPKYDEKLIQTITQSVVFALTHSVQSRDPTSTTNQTDEITCTEQRMEATFTNVLSSRKKIQLKKDVVMEGCTYNILKKNY